MKGYEDLVTLLKKVQATHGIDTDEKSVCEYQDMIGHSSQEQLKELANGVYKETFYRVYGFAYGTVEAIRFFTKNSDRIEAILRERNEAICDRDDMQDVLEKEKAAHQTATKNAKTLCDDLYDEKRNTERLQKELEAAQDEIIKLKARLFDLMEKAGA